MGQTAEQRRPDLPSLTAFRALAASAVFLAHSLVFMGPHPPTGLGEGARGGVGFFFVLSGAILAYNYGGGLSTRRYLRKRFARIYPVYLLAFLFGVAAEGAIHGFGFLSPEMAFKNVFMVQGWFPDGNSQTYPGTAWTLSCELLFYLSLPAMLPLLRKIPARAVGPAVLALMLISATAPGLLYDHEVISTPFFLSPLVYFPLFALGCLVGLQLPRLISDGQRFLRVHARTLLLGCGVATLLAWIAMTMTPEWMDFFVLVWPVAIVVGAAADINGAHVMNRPWMVIGGLWSYAFYSVHAPVIDMVNGALNGPSAAVGVPVAVLVGAGTWIGAGLLFRFWEEPLRERISRSRPKELAALSDGGRSAAGRQGLSA